MNIDAMIETIKLELCHYQEISLAILFGSSVKNRLHKESDIDLAIAGTENISNELKIQLTLNLSKRLKRETHLIDMSRSKGLILKEILTRGITIKCDHPELKSKHVIRMLDYIEDILPFQKATLQAKARKFAYGK